MNKIPCSAPILTYNSGKTLGRCLDSLKDFEEIILLDGGSTDETLAIAKDYGAKVYPQIEGQTEGKQIEDFTAMRLRALSFTMKPWILHIDSDEYIQPELVPILRKITNQLNIDVKTVYNLPRFAVVDKRLVKHAFCYPDYYVRFYHKESGVSFRLGKLVHEQRLIPQDVKIRNLEYGICSEWPSYKGCIAKDNYYLSLVNKKFSNAQKKPAPARQLRAVIKNLFLPIKIFLVSVRLTLRFGTEESLPMRYVWRFMRYHFIIAWLRSKYFEF
ncbi:glycosyltransferase family 2 protein [Patescibacteria group bacterium]|nr:glycosyltransferase family 2 protein [Patescibacteria group bacterium]MBU1921724.1 glycosyltransferase family 2 protein [Patescibacteria group bacterium]